MEVLDFYLNRDEQRFELRTGDYISFIEYREKDGVYDLTHTQVPVELTGQGIGKKLVKATLDYLRTEGRTAIGSCAFVARFFERNPDYADVNARG